MSIEGGENSQSSTFPGSTQRAPPPSFSASSFAGNQRKRPILSGLGSEPTTHSDFTSPNTPTPYESKGEISSLHARTTPSEPMSSFAAGTPIYKHASHPSPSTKEPHLSSIHSLLNEFQLHFDMKKQRISALESELSSVDGRLQQREIELQSYATERISSLEQLKNQKLLLDELQRKLAEFSKYESMISSRFANFEVLMKDLSATKANYLEKESELKKSKHKQIQIRVFFTFLALQEKNSHLEDSLRLIGELRVQKGQLESKSAELEDDLKQQCTEFNQKIHQLNTEIQEKSSRLDALYQEREILKADVKNMSFERDRFQRESAQALKEISALAVSDAFASLCPEDSLRSLSSAVNWIKGVCNDLQENQKHSENHFDLLKAEWTSELELSKGEVKCLQREVDSSQAKCTALQIEIDRLSQSIPTDDYLKIIEELGFSGPDWRSQLESFIEAQRDLEAKVHVNSFFGDS